MTLRKSKILSEPTVSEKDKAKHMSWCIKNGIKIYFEPIDWYRGHIIVDDNGKKYRSKEIYKQRKLKAKDKNYHEEIYKIYTTYYNLRNETGI